jgi:predicted PurR-regulated permease PerM
MIEQRVAPPTVPTWLVNLAAVGWRVLVVVAFAIVAVLIASLMAVVTATILISVIFGAAFAPLVLRLRARGWSRTRAAAAVTAGVVLLVGATLTLIVLAFVPYVAQVADAIEAARAQLQAALADLAIPPEIADAVDRAVEAVRSWLASQGGTVATALAQAATVGILSIFTVFFLLQDGDRAWTWALQAGAEWQQERVTDAGRTALERVGGYLRGLAVLAAVNAVRDFALMWILGVPLAGPLAVLVFILGFIPYFGGLIATLLIVVVAWASVGPQAAIVFLVAISVLNIIEGNVMMPLVYGKTVNIHPAVALVAILAGGAVGGILGVFAAIPLVAFAVALSGSLIAVIDTGRPAAGVVPGWLDRIAQWSWRLLVGIALVGLVLYVAESATSVVAPLVFSLIIAATFLPAVRRLTERGWKRGVASIVVTLAGIGTIVLLGFLSIVVMIPQLERIAAQATDGAADAGASTGGALEGLVDIVQTYGAAAVATAVAALAAIGILALLLIISTVLCFYFLKDGSRAWAAVLARIPAARRGEIGAAGERAVGVLGGYMIATGVISAFAAATQFAIMFLLGIPLALPLAVLAFFGGFIPYVGSLLTTLAAFLVTVAVGTPEQIAIMAAWTIVFNIVQGNVVAPLVYGRAVNIHPAVVLLALPAGSAVAGVIGMFLAVPFIGVVAATWRTVLQVFGPPPGIGPAIVAGGAAVGVADAADASGTAAGAADAAKRAPVAPSHDAAADPPGSDPA